WWGTTGSLLNSGWVGESQYAYYWWDQYGNYVRHTDSLYQWFYRYAVGTVLMEDTAYWYDYYTGRFVYDFDYYYACHDEVADYLMLSGASSTHASLSCASPRTGCADRI